MRRVAGFAVAASDEEKQDAQALMNMLMNRAQAELKANGVFLPTSASLGRTGDAVLDTPAAPEAAVEPAPLVERIAAALREGALVGRVRAAAFAADVRFGERGSDERKDAVQLHIEHERGYCVDIYVPYRRRRGWWRRAGRAPQWRVHFSHPVAQESTPVFWPRTES